MNLKIVVDNNIFISAMKNSCREDSPPFLIYQSFMMGEFTLIISEEQISELRDVVGRSYHKKHINPGMAGFVINIIRKKAKIITTKPLVSEEAKDCKDDFLIALCESGLPNILITGDKKAGLLQREKIGSSIVLSPTQFVERFLLSQANRQCTQGTLDELMHINRRHYTIQALSRSDKEVVIATSKTLAFGHYWIVPCIQNNEVKYLLLFGDYANRKSAENVLFNLPAISENFASSVVRQISNIHAEVRAYLRETSKQK